MPWEIFEEEAATYENWYATRRGRRADRAERALLGRFLALFPTADSVLEVGCGTGHFSGWLAGRGLRVVGLDRSPAMLAEMHRRCPQVLAVLGDAHRLPLRDAAMDLTLLVTTLEFLEDSEQALSEGIRVARQGVIVVALNRWSLGGLSRRWGPQARHPLLGRARDYSLSALRTALRRSAGPRLREVVWISTLFPDGLWRVSTRLPVGDVLGMMVTLDAAIGENAEEHS